MLIENQVCTLKQAKKLQELGIDKFKGLFRWCVFCPDPLGDNHYYEAVYGDGMDNALLGEYIADAFTVSEMQLMDGSLGNIELSEATYHKGEFYSTVNTEAQNWDERFRYYKTLAEAWGDKLIRGLEKGYYTASDCNTRLNSN